MSPNNGQHTRYKETFKQASVEFLDNHDRGLQAAPADLGVNPDDLRTWKRQPDVRGKPVRALSGMARLRAENEALRHQIVQLQVQWDILKTTLGVLSTTICSQEPL